MAAFKASIIQWNIRGARANKNSLEKIVSDFSPLFIALNETKMSRKDKINVKKYKTFKKDNDTPPTGAPFGGVAILVEPNVEVEEIPLVTELQAVAIKVSYPFEHIICNIYIPGSEKITKKSLEDLIDQLGKKFLLIGDLNGHNTIWGSNHTNARGSLIEKVCDRKTLTILNDNYATFLCKHTGNTSSLDLTITTPNISMEFSCNPIEDLNGSDHFPILIEYNNYVNTDSCPNKKKFIFDKAKWDTYQQNLNFTAFDQNIIKNPELSIDQIVEHFNSRLVEAAETAIPRTSEKLKKNQKRLHWWTAELTDITIRKKRSFKKYRRTRNDDDKKEYYELQEIQKEKMVEAKKKSWQEFVKSINSFTNAHEVWEKIGKIKGSNRKSKITAIKVNNNLITDPKIICEKFAEHFHKISSDNALDAESLHNKNLIERKTLNLRSQINDEHFNLPFASDEIKEILNDLTGTSEGEDGIHNYMLKYLNNTGTDILLKIINKIWTEQTFPAQWQSAKIIPIPKPEKDKTLMTNYRGISLISCTAKIMERLVNKRLTYFLETNSLISNNQSGFRRYRSTADNLVTLEHHIKEGFCRKQDTLAVFFDMEKAYDTTWRRVIIDELIERGIEGNMLNYLNNFLTNRKIKIVHKNFTSNPKTLENGIPQGSVLSCALFNIAIDTILTNIDKPVQALLYADDLVIFATNRDTELSRNLIQNAINTLVPIIKKIGIKFSKAKTKAVLFTRKQKKNIYEPDISIENEKIEFVQKYKFLGMQLDKKLNFHEHIDYIKNKTRNSMNILKYLSHSNYGSDREMMLRIHQALIVSQMDYCGFLYENTDKTSLKKLDTTHRTGLRLATGAFVSSPAESLHAEAGVAPLEIRRSYLGMSYLIKVMANDTHPAHDALSNMAQNSKVFQKKGNARKKSFLFRTLEKLETVENIADVEEINSQFFNNLPYWNPCNIKFDKTLTTIDRRIASNEEYRSKFSKILKNNIRLANSNQNIKILYTDGSVMNGRSAYAIIDDKKIYGSRLPDYTSIYTAELHAISKCVEIAATSECDEIIICTDSLSALQAIEKLAPKDQIAMRIRDQIQENTDKKFTIIWVPAHHDIEGNEKADEAAKNFCKNSRTERIPITMRDMKALIKRHCREKFSEDWTKVDPKNNKLREIKDNTRKHKEINNIKRKDAIKITRMRIGHTRLTHSYLIEKKTPPVCDCGEIITIKHIFDKCPKHQRTRLKMNINMQSLASDNKDNYKNILNFIKKIKIYNEI